MLDSGMLSNLSLGGGLVVIVRLLCQGCLRLRTRQGRVGHKHLLIKTAISLFNYAPKLSCSSTRYVVSLYRWMHIAYVCLCPSYRNAWIPHSRPATGLQISTTA